MNSSTLVELQLELKHLREQPQRLREKKEWKKKVRSLRQRIKRRKDRLEKWWVTFNFYASF